MNSRIKKILLPLDKGVRIPSSYSFIVSGSHGVGLYAFLYQLSQCVHNERKVFPLPWGTFVMWNSIDLINLRFYKYFFENKVYSKMWGISFDGSPKRSGWLEKNCKKNVPTFCLIRDPISILVSCLNQEIATSIFDHIEYNLDESIKRICHDKRTFNMSFGFYANSEFFIKNGNQIIFIDTIDYSGNVTINTFKSKLFFDFEIPKENKSKMLINVNGAFERRFPKTLCVDGVDYRVGIFSDGFINNGMAQYCPSNSWTYVNEYISPLFPNKKLYFFSKHQLAQRKIYRAQEQLDLLLGELREKMDYYERSKVVPEQAIEILRKNFVYDSFMTQVNKEIWAVLKIDPSIEDRWTSWNHFK